MAEIYAFTDIPSTIEYLLVYLSLWLKPTKYQPILKVTVTTLFILKNSCLFVVVNNTANETTISQSAESSVLESASTIPPLTATTKKVTSEATLDTSVDGPKKNDSGEFVKFILPNKNSIGQKLVG